MDFYLFLLPLLGLLSGICSSYLGVGGSLFIVPLLPVLVGFSPIESLQISLSMIFVMSFINTVSFYYQKLILWNWVYPIILTGLGFSFLSSFLIQFTTATRIRFVLWLFLTFMLFLPFLLKKLLWLCKKQGVYIFGSLMGLCVGCTGLGGGFILSPYLHESSQIPSKNVSAVVCCSMFGTSFFALLGQLRAGFLWNHSNLFWWKCYLLLLIPSIVGLFVGYALNKKDKNSKRRSKLLRFLISLIFLKVSLEFF